MLHPLRLLTCLPLLTGLLSGADADLILHNGKILTVDAKFSIVQAVAIKGGRFVAVGDDRTVLAERGSRTKVVNLRGQTVVPGLMDSHVHPLEGGLSEFREPLPVLDSHEAIRNYIREQAKKTPKGQWIIVPRTFPTRLKELRMPTREVLDVATEHPVMLDASYVVVANTLALKISGITRNTPNPPRGEIVHDEHGEPNGILKNAQSLLKGLKPAVPFTPEEKLRALEKMLSLYRASGLTCIGDGAVGEEEIALFEKLKAQGRLPIRVVMTWWNDASRPLADLKREVESKPYTTNTGDEWLKFGAYKINFDGGMTIGTAYQRHPYGPFGRQLYGKTNPDDRGQLFQPYDKLLDVLRAAHRKGWALTAHTQGGGAIDLFLDAMEALNREKPIAPSRSHMIHASFQSPEAIQRMKKLGVLGDVQAAWLYCDAPALEKVFGAQGMRYFFPLRSYIDAGVIVAGGSDHMIGWDRNRAINPYNPFHGMWVSVTRKTVRGSVIQPQERISREEALKMYTIWAAYRMFSEKARGSIERGKLADLVVIDRDYLTCPEDDITKIEPVMMVLDGKVTFQR
jgi:hypothetical protein